MINANNHTFVILAYKEDPHLEKCIESIINQTVFSKAYINTSTPNDFIYSLARKYNLPVNINKGSGTLADNFNFAIDSCNTNYATICHQDDYFDCEYLESIINNSHDDNDMIFFTDYAELHGDTIVYNNKLLKIKKIMLFPFRSKKFSSSIKCRRRILGIGDPVCCPSITYNKKAIADVRYDESYKTALDYDFLERLSTRKGRFVYVAESLFYHRISDDTESRVGIDCGYRTQEELEIMKRLWPQGIAKFIAKRYAKAQTLYL